MQFFVVTALEFIAQRNRLCPSLAPFVTPHTVEEYEKLGTLLYLSADRLCGFGITAGGELVSVFSLVRCRGHTLAMAAVALGGVHLDCLGEHLRELYERVGFVVRNKLPWNDEYAPDDWNYERFGRPTYYEMAHASCLAMTAN